MHTDSEIRGFMAQPLVSIITPTYNHGKYIGRALESILAQSYTNWELIVVDDGSTDNTSAVVREFGDSRIRYMFQQNRGVRQLAATINAGLEVSSGSLVTMFASDDTWPAYRLEKQVPVFVDDRVVLVYGWGRLIDENDTVLGEIDRPPTGVNLSNSPIGSALHHMLVSNYVFQPSVLLRRSALEQIGGYLQPEGLLAEDYPTHLTLATIGEFRYIDLPFANYRMHQGQMTRNHYLEMLNTDVPYVMQFFRSLSPEMRERSGWTEASLARRLRSRLHQGLFVVGRRDLLAGNWREARRHFGQAVIHGNIQTKLKALVGIGCSLFHSDMEVFARTAGRTPLR